MGRLLRRAVILVAVLAAVYCSLYLRSRAVGHAVALKYAHEPLPGELVVRPAFAFPALKGTFGENARVAIEDLAKVIESSPFGKHSDLWTECNDVRDGKVPVDNLSAGCRALLDAGRDAMHRVMAAARSESSGTPPVMRGWSRVKDAIPYWMYVRQAAQLGALEARIMLSRGETAHAVERCEEIVALGREATVAGYILGRFQGIGIQHQGALVCRDALGAASPVIRHTAHEVLVGLERSMPGFDHVTHTEATWGALEGCGGLLSEAERAAMPAENRALAEEDVMRPDPGMSFYRLLRPITLGDICRGTATLNEGLGEVGKLPPAEQHAAAEALVARYWWMDWLLPSQGAFKSSWTQYVDRDRDARAELAEIVRAAE